MASRSARDPEPRTIATGVYRHNKSGKTYEVIGVALHTEISEQLVVYRPLYASDYELFVRPYAMFTELVHVNGRMMPRFERIETPRTFIA